MDKKSLLFLILLLCLIVSCGDLQDKVNKGNNYYSLEKYDAALQQYKSAAQDFPTSGVAHYNLGNALYKRGKFTDAAEEYRKLLASESRVLRQKAYYNLGNTYLKLGNLKYAIDSYKSALSLNHKDFDAKYNLEFALEQLKSRKSHWESQQGKDGQSNQNRLSQPEERPEKQSEESIDKQHPGQGEMTKEDVMKMLEALKGEEKNLQMLQLLRRIPKKKVRVEKDW